MWYITTQLDIKSIGGFGHSYYDIISSYIISELYDIVPIYSSIPNFTNSQLNKKYSSQIQKSKNLIGPGTLNSIIDSRWLNVLGFDKEKHIDSLNCEKVYIRLTKHFFCLSKSQLDNFFTKFDRNKDIIFILDQNNRIYLCEFYNWDNSLYEKLRLDIKDKCLLNNTFNKKNIVVHIRGGDTFNEPLNAIYNKLQAVLKYIIPTDITIISYGSDSQINQIKETFKNIENIKYELNTDIFKCFEIMVQAYILLCGKSSYPKVAAYYSDAIVIYKKEKYKCPSDEVYTNRYIHCNDNGNFDEKKFQSLL